MRRDLSTGAMPCQEHTAVLLASYVVQGKSRMLTPPVSFETTMQPFPTDSLILDLRRKQNSGYRRLYFDDYLPKGFSHICKDFVFP